MEKVLEIKNLSVGHPDKLVLQGVNVNITKGEMVGIIGCNGAGKSTLLKTIRGIIPKVKGEVLYFDKPLEQYKEKELATKVAYLQQNVETSFGYTCLDIVLAGRYPYMKWYEGENEKDKQLARDCLAYTGTLDLADRSINMISGGQKQRVLLAKILAQQTPIMFLDEPTTGLDMVYQEEIFRFAKALADMGKTVLMVVHELNLAAKYCSRVLLIGEGTLLADGAPREVLTEKLLSTAYHADVVVNKNPITGAMEISTREDEKKQKSTLELLKRIC